MTFTLTWRNLLTVSMGGSPHHHWVYHDGTCASVFTPVITQMWLPWVVLVLAAARLESSSERTSCDGDLFGAAAWCSSSSVVD